MGGLSRKRKQARLVKKVRKASQKRGLNLALLPEGIRKHWTDELSVKDNFKQLGLTLTLQPRMLQSKEGSKITNAATRILHPAHFEGRDEVDSESEKEEVKPERNYNDIFPEIKSEKLVPFEKTGKKLAFEEDNVCKKMIAKYGEDYSKMSKDIKINYLQWSQGQVQQKIKIYLKSL